MNDYVRRNTDNGLSGERIFFPQAFCLSQGHRLGHVRAQVVAIVDRRGEDRARTAGHRPPSFGRSFDAHEWYNRLRAVSVHLSAYGPQGSWAPKRFRSRYPLFETFRAFGGLGDCLWQLIDAERLPQPAEICPSTLRTATLTSHFAPGRMPALRPKRTFPCPTKRLLCHGAAMRCSGSGLNVARLIAPYARASAHGVFS